MVNDTIAAISTPTGEGGIAIVRISGLDAVKVADRVLRLKAPLSDSPSHTIHYGHLVDSQGLVVDEVIASLMRAPRSYTCEDTVEINCHAGNVAAAQALQVVLHAGARVAEPGEFTKRAFLNGRIDLTQAEAVAGVIRAHTEGACTVAQNLLSGRLTTELGMISALLLQVCTHIEANLDFADDDIEPADAESASRNLEEVIERLQRLISTRRHSELIENGALIAIVGKPNVGKSSLLNMLSGEERAIVDGEPGTTRDTIEARISIEGILVTLVDTAGVRATEHLVEAKGVARSWEAAKRADLVIWVFDGSKALEEADTLIADGIGDATPFISVSNKSDLGVVIHDETMPHLPPRPRVTVSAISSLGLDALKAEIVKVLSGGEKLEAGRVILGSARQRQGIEEANRLINQAHDALTQGVGEEIVSELVRQALQVIGEITGNNYCEELLDTIFSTFCIGK